MLPCAIAHQAGTTAEFVVTPMSTTNALQNLHGTIALADGAHNITAIDMASLKA